MRSGWAIEPARLAAAECGEVIRITAAGHLARHHHRGGRLSPAGDSRRRHGRRLPQGSPCRAQHGPSPSAPEAAGEAPAARTRAAGAYRR